jgi:four helix bundle protein
VPVRGLCPRRSNDIARFLTARTRSDNTSNQSRLVRAVLCSPAMKSRDLKVRSFEFAVAVVAVGRLLKKHDSLMHRIAERLIASAGSVGANIEEAAAGQSRRDFIAKNCIALKEALEARYWLRLVVETTPALAGQTAPLVVEASEIIRMLAASINTARRRAAQ